MTRLPGIAPSVLPTLTQITDKWLRDGEVIMIHITPSAADIAAMITGSSRSFPLKICLEIRVQKI